MKRCDEVRDRLLDDADPARLDAECRDHLASCPDCAAGSETLRHLSTALRPDEAFPRENEVDWAGFARHTVMRAISEDAVREMTVPAAPAAPGWLDRLAAAARALLPTTSSARQRLAWASGAMLLVAGVAMAAMMMLSPPQDPGAPPVPQQASISMPEGNIDNLTVNLARQNTARYINETRAVLVTLLDVKVDCDDDKVDVSAERAKATELLRRQRLIAAELDRVPLARAQDVCGELGRLLLEISTLADCAKDSELQTLRDVVEKRQILVRMELLSAELARREAQRA
ncbi:MAG: zf-HC2 domain-containing protein [Candidatus Polarisedimenticolia bacterium]